MSRQSKKSEPIARFDKVGMVKVGLILKNAREQKGLTLDELADLTGVGKTRLNDVELANGNKLMVDTLEAYRRVVRPFNPETGKDYQCWELLEIAMILEDPRELEQKEN
ncbi:helix-turn-helix transcriptional regulator [Planktothrix sp. FACHB-1355]|nr:helix-turn-helix transcriptional regulator [Planktothrix sp. FACHB-1355]